MKILNSTSEQIVVVLNSIKLKIDPNKIGSIRTNDCTMNMTVFVKDVKTWDGIVPSNISKPLVVSKLGNTVTHENIEIPRIKNRKNNYIIFLTLAVILIMLCMMIKY